MKTKMESAVFVMEGHPGNWQDAIRMTGKELYRQGCVYEDFFQHCIERELKYPTGLNTLVPVAIPHTEAVNVKKTAACLMRLEEPVKFRSMENDEEEIEIEFVLNLAVNDSGVHLKALQATITLFQDEAFKSKAGACSLEELKEIFLDNWNHME